MTVKEAAKQMGVSEQFIRLGLQQGRFPWGYAVKMRKRYSYFINSRRFYDEEQSLKSDYSDRNNFIDNRHQRDGFREQSPAHNGGADIDGMAGHVPSGQQEALG